MRLLSVMVIACIVFLSSFGGSITPVQTKAMDCCKKMAHHQPTKQKNTRDCGEPGCPMMFACSTCGFVVIEPLTIKPPFTQNLQKPVAHYTPGNIADYHANDWKPPKNC